MPESNDPTYERVFPSSAGADDDDEDEVVNDPRFYSSGELAKSKLTLAVAKTWRIDWKVSYPLITWKVMVIVLLFPFGSTGAVKVVWKLREADVRL
jgi:hypothetical protein